MRKKHILLSFILLPCIAFAQSKIPFTSLKPFNKGNVKIDLSYSRLMQKHPPFDYPDFHVGIGYGIANWCVVGVFGSFGTYDQFLTIGGGYGIQGTDTIYHPVLFDGMQIDRYYHYGIDAELHPLSFLLPNFYFVDIYCRGDLGLRTITEQYIPDYEDLFTEPIRNEFLIGGSVGLAINPSRYFGVFYELAYNNLNKEPKKHFSGKTTPKSIHRWGFNIRFPGPKKWQR